jgi:hypothetical protein
MQTVNNVNFDLSKTLTDERQQYKELIKVKGRACCFCDKPLEFTSQTNCANCGKHSCSNCLIENMLHCFDCKRYYCKQKCKVFRKVYVCDKHSNLSGGLFSGR